MNVKTLNYYSVEKMKLLIKISVILLLCECAVFTYGSETATENEKFSKEDETLLKKLNRLSVDHEIVTVKYIEGVGYRFGNYLIKDLQSDTSIFHPDFEHYEVVHENKLDSETKKSRFITSTQNLDCVQVGRISEYNENRNTRLSEQNGKVYLNTCGDLFSALIVFENTESDEEKEFNLIKVDSEHVVEGEGAFSAAFYKFNQLNEKWSCGGHHTHAQDFHHDHDRFERPPVEGLMESFIGVSESEMDFNKAGKERNLQSFNPRRQSKTKYVQLLIVNDNEQFRKYGKNTHAKALKYFQTIKLLYEKLNEKFAKMYKSPYRIELSISGMLTFRNKDPWNLGEDPVDASKVLEEFNHWREANSRNKRFFQHSTAHLISGRKFVSPTVGVAYVAGICNAQGSSGVNQASGFEEETVATIMAHELAHNLAVYHTDKTWSNSLVTERCYNSIMDSNGIYRKDWSECTVNQLKMLFDGSNSKYPFRYGQNPKACLEERPTYSYNLGSTCGNGLKEPGEQCDCGATVCKDDPCCDGATCTFKDPDYECSRYDPCCDKKTCLIVSSERNKVCRPAVSECDIEEKCDGQQSKCPADQYHQTGRACESFAFNKTISGVCHLGNCNSHAGQCAEYDGMTDKCPDYDEYLDGDEMCGNLKCFNGRSCNYVRNQEGGIIKVNDGTKCGQGRVCQANKNKCVKASVLELPSEVQCFNGIMDGSETDIDCGGNCEPCLPGDKCLQDNDCYEEEKCDGSSLTAPEKYDEVRDEDLRRPEDHGGGRCQDFSSESKCDQWSGCVWLEEFTLCKPTALLPPSGECKSQKKRKTCINYKKCEWNYERETCRLNEAILKKGTCSGVIYTGYAAEYEKEPGFFEKMIDEIVKFWNEHRTYSYIIIGVLGLSLLSCCWSCCCSCKKRRELENARKVHRQNSRRAHRQRLEQESVNIPVVQGVPVSVPVEQGVPNTGGIPVAQEFTDHQTHAQFVPTNISYEPSSMHNTSTTTHESSVGVHINGQSMNTNNVVSSNTNTTNVATAGTSQASAPALNEENRNDQNNSASSSSTGAPTVGRGGLTHL